MATIPEALTAAIEHHQGGRLRAAEQIYRQILHVNPNQADAIHLLGLIAHQVGKHDVAVEYIERAIELNATNPAFQNNLGEAYRALHRIPEAVACYRRALELKLDFAEALSNLGGALNDQGKLDEAVACCHRALALRPDYPEAHNNLGCAFKYQGKLDEAAACYRRTLALNPEYVQAHNNLGCIWKDQGKLAEAVACYRRAIDLKPDFAEAYNNLGNTWKDQGKLDEAVACYRHAIDRKPRFAEAYNNLGNTWKDQGKLDEAVACYRHAIELKPKFAEAHNNLGIVSKSQGKLDEAVAYYHQTLALKPDYAEACSNLGNAFKDQGRLDEAVTCCRRALALKPELAEAHINLGNALKDQGKLAEAVTCFHRALELKPDYAEAYNNLGCALNDLGKLDEAVHCCHRALELKPNYPEAHNNLGNGLKSQGKLDEAVACYRRALELKPNYAEAHDNLLLALHYFANVTPAALAAAHAEYDRQYAAPLGDVITPHENALECPARLRLGFVSADLGRHPVGYFLIGVLENLNKKKHDTVCYSDQIVKDDLTQCLQAAATEWRDVMSLSDERLAQQIRSDRIDILFDLAGHTAHNRLLVFARKPAPIQVTWAGYVGTTGLTAMDYLLADRYEVPPGAEQHHQEQVLRMPNGYVCYKPPSYAPPVAPLPALNCGKVNFGCFNNPAKVTPQVIETWARILHRLSDARLVLRYRGWNDPNVVQRYIELFATHGIDPIRVEFLGHSPHAELLDEYNRVDLALDPFPYSGGLTTCEALWMGVPVITCPFETFASRHSLSHLSNVGLTETIARDLDEYVELAVTLAEDLPRLARTRARLRKRMAASPLCDTKRFATNLTRVLRDAWRKRCQELSVSGQD